ncbi:Isoquinoline 1-oxidoreductase subunit [Pontivivens ytuae]|uniref:Isoquinoline 1-oxidoreductase subunit n=1 Tax=Pontivivens ytuae TaxID=2789856 RepID=A0A7S9LQA8_9RHOB|nr:Isoquinoline 1-oxidoreductase subunit [Pontivivens ytuae]QPH53005.1 Isoquinoline 1-oxidoreductase subunit [Pontivivens ytuae]
MKTLLATGAALAALALSLPLAAQDTLREVSSFDSIEDEEERAQAIFREMAKVITHPRCMNCHPVDNFARQGDAMAMHQPPVVRYDEGGFGAPGLQCNSCHGVENVAYATGTGSIPGHEPWHLAPGSMGWIGLTVGEICQQIQDPERNGGRTLADIHEHHAEDGLVGWAWDPGEGRTPAPGSQALFGDLTQAWIDAGAHCPS